MNLRESVKVKSRGKTITRLLKAVFPAILAAVIFYLAGVLLKHLAIAEIAELAKAQVKAEKVSFNLNGSVVIKKLAVISRQSDTSGSNILEADNVYARFAIASLLRLKPRLKEIKVSRFLFNAQYDSDSGRWNLTPIEISFAMGGEAVKIPVIKLENGTLRYSRRTNQQVKTISEILIDAELRPDKKEPNSFTFLVTTAKVPGKTAKSTLRGLLRPGKITVAGGIASTDLPGMNWSVKAIAAELVYDRNNQYRLKLKMNDLALEQTPERGEGEPVNWPLPGQFKLFESAEQFLETYNPRGRIDLELQAEGNLREPGSSRLDGKVHCIDVTIYDEKFPYELRNINGWIRFTERSAAFDNLKAKHGEVDMTIEGWTEGFGAEHSYQVKVKSENMRFDSDLYNALSAGQKRMWDSFAPKGTAATEYEIKKNISEEPQKRITAKLLGASALYRGFPYPLENLTGSMSFSDKETALNVESAYEGRKINIEGRINELQGVHPLYELNIRAENIPLDRQLLEALPEGQRKFYRRFRPVGQVDANIIISNNLQRRQKNSYTAEVKFSNAAFSLPLPENGSGASEAEGQSRFVTTFNNVSGAAQFTAGLITIRNMKGTCGEAPISISGKIWPADSNDRAGCSLEVNAEMLRLTKEIFAVLPEKAGRLIWKLQPQGKIGLKAELNVNNRQSGQDEYSVKVKFLGGEVSFSAFPYPVKNITGELTITKDSILLGDISAEPADANNDIQETGVIKINGRAMMKGDDYKDWTFHIAGRNLGFNKRIALLLPEGLKGLYEKMQPSGKFDLNIDKLNVSVDDGGESIDFHATADFKNCAISELGAITELNATMEAQGQYRTAEGLVQAKAALQAAKIRIRGKELNELAADVNYDNRTEKWSAENLKAGFYGGKLTGRFEIRQNEKSALDYQMEAGFEGVELGRFLSDNVRHSAQNGQTSGRMGGTLSLSGTIGDAPGRIGLCRVRIDNMQAGRLSPLAKLLYVLKLTEPKNFAFERMLIDSYITGDRLFFRKFDLAGDAVAFNGSGQMNLGSDDIDLTLTARGHRLASDEPTVLQSLQEGIGLAVVRMNVRGNVYDPQVTTTTLPVIGETLGLLGTRQK